MPITTRDDLLAIVALRARRFATNRDVAALIEKHGTAASAAAATLTPAALDAARAAVDRVERDGVRLLGRDDPEYPPLLRETADAPLALFVRGALAAGDDPAVAVVGSRRASPEGRHLARAIGEALGALGVTVVSGMARGVDGEAHRGALHAGGRTIGVLGSGIDVVYPAEHRRLAAEVAGSGAVLSELAPGARPLQLHFPMRNRILAGLSRVVVVVEAAERSGSLITARLAADAHRAVLAVPGSPLSAAHAGTNRLIQEFAGLVQTLDDVIEAIPIALRPRRRPGSGAPVKPSETLTDKQGRVLAVLDPTEARHIDEVAARAGLAGSEAAAALLELELLERAARIAGARYLRRDAPGAFQAPTPWHGDTFQPPVLSSQG